mmetsp:Transcript_78358/g.196735  ORF Transcript_78358/g.196735 Transcript_78358/m.196735 type:complete len:541 (+) Transcript_78358:65-1687(+)|eukprot:CAMPEP_0115465516 /NCGR_PEP_ID=MMETSP0271-20121206/49441_1 /TAXON_ID=71861 /ORGANISM="Scrippsiella trochoidea, Strain CCMP3099" /LENGTH=540 /DNA_ID=CAMNT_0002892459 /DNA_START=41 /DNA_END=1663 /DNA_ORIENTATION=+
MFDLIIGGGGCLVGVASTQALTALRQRKAKASEKSMPKVPMASPFGRHSTAPWSPLKMMSPPTHLRRDPVPAGQQPSVSADASLTKKMADFRMAAGVPKDLDKAAFVEMLRKLIGESKHLQNNPRLGITPQETRAAKAVMDELAPYSTKNGGPLILEELEYVSGRSNLKVVYPGTTDKTIAFVGSHFDVVPADPETWSKDPFQLTVEGDKLYGRGTTDCLGHVALVTRLLAELGKSKPPLKRSIVVLFIAGEEGGEKGVGVDAVVKDGKLEEVKKGPVYWVDSADSQPCCGTSGMMSWSVKCSGRLFHSGFPNKGINSIEMASEVCAYMQQRFYEDFPAHPSEDGYGFATGSHMKPTQIECAKGSLNQICPETTVSGDIRLSPFYDVEDVKAAVEQYVQDLNEGELESLPTRGQWSKFALEKGVETQANELRRGVVELKWQGDLDTFKLYAGIACKLDSEGHKALVQACRETYASVRPFSVNGSLPLVKMMQKQGFDIQMCGFGLMSVYHGVNEYCTLTDMQRAHEVILRMICLLESVTQ